MAERRMFSKAIINSARFLKMPSETQALYFHLGLHADDDGVVEAYNVMRFIGVGEDSLKLLVAKNFVYILNDDLVSYILDWNEHNKIRADRKIDSIYKNLLLQIVPEAKLIEPRIRADVLKKQHKEDVDNQWTSIGQHRIGKVSKEYIPAKTLQEDEFFEKFNLIWKEYSINFLKAKFNRRGGSKEKAKKNFFALLNKRYSIDDIVSLVRSEHSLDYPRDLERVLHLNSMKQFIEDREVQSA